MSMTENEAIKVIGAIPIPCRYIDNDEEILKAYEVLKNSLEEIQQYRAIGTIEEFKDLKEKSASVEECLNTLVAHCKLRKKNQASCLGCPVRKSYGTKQPEVCKLNMVERPSDLELNIDWSE